MWRASVRAPSFVLYEDFCEPIETLTQKRADSTELRTIIVGSPGAARILTLTNSPI